VTGISVVIPHYGSAEPTNLLVDRLLAQDTHHTLQIIVIDDHSPTPFPEREGLVMCRRADNGGFGSAVNSGAREAEHDLLLILNSDVVIDSRFVEDLVTAASPWMPAVVSPRVTGLDGHEVWTGRHFPTVRHQFVEWLTPLARWRDQPPLHEAVGHDTRVREGATTAVDWVVGAAMLLPTQEFRAVGGFDERFFMNSEEIDLQRRLRERGVPSVLLGTPLALHEGGGSSDSEHRRAWLVKSRLDYAEKWGRRRRLVSALATAAALNFVWNSGRRALGRDVHPVSTARAELSLLGMGIRS
jgi:N-acetylglucosaminyl-diphospho-decaprenol L-rhamnosyltransferase